MRRIALLAGLILSITAFPTAYAEGPAAGSVLVGCAAIHQGSLPDLLDAFGSVAPAQNGGMVMSLQQDGRIAAILVTQGERVARGTPLLAVELNPGSTSAYAQALSAASLARSQRTHTAQLLAQHLATRDQLAQADKALSDATTTVEALKRQGADQSHTSVAAPFEGIVSTIAVSQGDRVASGTPLLTIMRLDGLVLTVGIDARMQHRVRPGQNASLQRLETENHAPAIASQVLRVDSMVNPKTRLVDVDLALPAQAALSGDVYRATITLGTLQGWIVPHDAVLEDATGYFLFQLRAQGSTSRTAARVRVQLLGTAGDQDAVTGPLDPKSSVITEGATQLADGDAVRSAP